MKLCNSFAVRQKCAESIGTGELIIQGDFISVSLEKQKLAVENKKGGRAYE